MEGFFSNDLVGWTLLGLNLGFAAFNYWAGWMWICYFNLFGALTAMLGLLIR